jgi:hypothetical protein
MKKRYKESRRRGKFLHTVNRRKTNWIGHNLHIFEKKNRSKNMSDEKTRKKM